MKRLISVLLLGVALWQGGQWALIEAKARLAPLLQARAFNISTFEKQHPPWPWADHYVYGKLWLDPSQPTIYALGGDIYRAMAFGPTVQMVGNTAIISAHRDTHFKRLRDIKPGAFIQMQQPGLKPESYVVRDIWTAHKDRLFVPDGGMTQGLLLVTCYPFDALQAGGPLRYLVWAEPIADQFSHELSHQGRGLATTSPSTP